MVCKRCGKKLKKILLYKEFIEKIGIINNNYDSSNEVLKPNIINNLNINENFYNIILETMNKKAESLFLSKKEERENNLYGFEKIKGEYYTHDN